VCVGHASMSVASQDTSTCGRLHFCRLASHYSTASIWEQRHTGMQLSCMEGIRCFRFFLEMFSAFRVKKHAPHCTLPCNAKFDRGVQVKLWDARSGDQITTYHGHQDRVNVVSFHWNGNWLISGSKDATCRLFELRMNRELHRYSAHSKEVNTIAWHPCIETLFASGM
jgi:WD40 repeat protein